MPDDEFIVEVMGVLAAIVAVKTLVGAVLLCAAVALHNKLAGGASSSSSVPQPTYGKAMWAMLATSMAQIIVGALMGAATSQKGQDVNAATLLIYVPINFLIMAGILSGKLSMPFERACLVTLWYTLAEILLVGFLAGIALLVLRYVLI
jgi:hypothetical protein